MGLCGLNATADVGSYGWFGAENLQVGLGTYHKNNLSAPGGVASRLKMLTYYVYAQLFCSPTPCQER